MLDTSVSAVPLCQEARTILMFLYTRLTSCTISSVKESARLRRLGAKELHERHVIIVARAHRHHSDAQSVV